ncbi:hypothetical protein RMSM_03202 [Rhodopirellula maiorica SM1]|uniref:Uncharacterized protein n=1 Tax=Rhodopirellula maiorica SM1 TaxID=1265738 RepID=M5RL20_9BACT|nr:carboxypeptidase-like regulatory domain-containing protein [Rhodopirellula maiorica]EMI19876.1 hypothetical protein RMSM_03202 [Rhodopirellula maiorica SM1]
MNGFEVEMDSVGDVQAAEATGVSNVDGIGLTRSLPYGRYRMTVSGNGWHARDLVTLEVGKPLALTVVAPTPNQLGELHLQASLATDGLTDFPFGEWEVKGNRGWGTRIVPQPGEIQQDSGDWKTFPTVSDGIDVVAVVVEIAIKRRIKQPSGNHLTWEWRQSSDVGQQPSLKWLVQSDGTVRPLLSVSEQNCQISRPTAWFQNLAPDKEKDSSESERSSHSERLGYHVLTLGSEHQDSAGIELPAGQFQLSNDTIYGRPTPNVLQVIDKKPESTAEQIWLHGVILHESPGWLTRLLGDSWDHDRRGVNKEVDVALDARKEVAIGVGKQAASDDVSKSPRG